MGRSARNRSHTTGDTGFFPSLFNTFKAPAKREPEVTYGFMPATLRRMSSGLSERHVLGISSKPAATSKPVLSLKRLLTTSSEKNHGTVAKRASPRAESGASTDSSQRIQFVPELLAPGDGSVSGTKRRHRAPSPYPAVKQPVPPSMGKEPLHSEPIIRTRARTLTRDRIDAIQNIEQYLETYPDALPPPGSTPAFVDQYWTSPRRRDSNGSYLSDPEASDAESTDPDRWECDTAYDSDEQNEDEHRLAPPISPRPYTPVATRPLLMTHALSFPLPNTFRGHHIPTTQETNTFIGEDTTAPPRSDYSPDFLSSTTCGSSLYAQFLPHLSTEATKSWDPYAWLPTDPSNMDRLHYREFPVPRLLWKRALGADGTAYTTSLRPPRGATAGRTHGQGGPTHTPVPGYCHGHNPRLWPVDAAELKERLKNLLCQQASSPASSLSRTGNGSGSEGASTYDADQKRIRDRYASWEGGVGRAALDDGAEAASVAAVEHCSVDCFPLPPGAAGEAELAVPDKDAEGGSSDSSAVDDTDVSLPNYAGADPTTTGEDTADRWPRTGCLPKSKAHRQRAASKLDEGAARQAVALSQQTEDGPIAAIAHATGMAMM